MKFCKSTMQERFLKRVSRLQNNKQIILKDGRYFINSPIMLSIAKTIAMLKLMLLASKVNLIKITYYHPERLLSNI